MRNQIETDVESAASSRRRFLTTAVCVGAACCIAEAGEQSQESKPEKDEKKMLGRCGYRCDLCAARSDDPAVRQKMVDLWRKYWGHQKYTAENVRCDGCTAGGRLADKTCGVRPCVIEKGIPNCAHCDKAPCEKLRKLCSSPHFNWVRFGDVPQEDYDLAMRQFDNVPELIELRRKLKKK